MDYEIFAIIGQLSFNPINAVPREIHTTPENIERMLLASPEKFIPNLSHRFCSDFMNRESGFGGKQAFVSNRGEKKLSLPRITSASKVDNDVVLLL